MKLGKITKTIHNSLFWLYLVLFAALPLLIFHKSFEIFEFPKLILLYSATSLVTLLWVIRSILVGKFIFNIKPVGMAFVFFLLTQILSTVFSIDPRTSLLGFYSRYNGSLLTTICYTVLFFIYVNTFNFKELKKHLSSLVITSVIVSVIGIFEHYKIYLTCVFSNSHGFWEIGTKISNNCWDQNVSERVISTLGQPNWLASWIALVAPLSWMLLFKKRFKYISLAFSVLLFLALNFTKSRSGILAFITTVIVFWTSLYFQNPNKILKHKAVIRIFFVFIFIISLIFSKNYFGRSKITSTGEIASTSETRKIIWRGAFEIWKRNPIIGSGVETFASEFEKFKPKEINTTTEWNYLFNKAHNEYIHILATSGIFGLISYLYLIYVIIRQYFYYGKKYLKSRLKIKGFEKYKINLALFSGFSGLLVSNFFGFSVIPTSFLFYLYPAFSLAQDKKNSDKEDKSISITNRQVWILAAIIIATVSTQVLIVRYLVSDTIFAKGYSLLKNSENIKAEENVTKALKLNRNEPLYWSTLAQIDSNLALKYGSSNDPNNLKKYMSSAEEKIIKSLKLSPYDPRILKNSANSYTKLGLIDNKFLKVANEKWQSISSTYPNDAQSQYEYAISELRINNSESAITQLKKVLTLKPNYRDAHFALALIYQKNGKIDDSMKELETIINSIDPNDQASLRLLKTLRENSKG